MLEPKVSTLLGFIRVFIAGTANVDSLKDIDWDWTYCKAFAQGISALVLDAIVQFPYDNRPPKSLLLQWIGRMAMQERAYERHQAAIASLAAFYEQHDIKMLLLKGYGCSLCWPRPEHRPTGDMDIYLFGRQKEADALVARELDINVRCEYHKHSTFNYHCVEVENHAKFIDDVSHKSNVRFEVVLEYLLHDENCVKSPIGNVLLPPPTFNALFLLRHTGEHFAANEITLRQVLDVGTFFGIYHASINWKILYEVLCRERMLDFFNGIATICVDYFGMNAVTFASTDGRYSYCSDVKLAERILTDMFREKRSCQILPMSTVSIDTWTKKISYGINKTIRWWRNRWKYRLVYNENMLQSFWWLAKNRMK